MKHEMNFGCNPLGHSLCVAMCTGVLLHHLFPLFFLSLKHKFSVASVDDAQLHQQRDGSLFTLSGLFLNQCLHRFVWFGLHASLAIVCCLCLQSIIRTSHTSASLRV